MKDFPTLADRISYSCTQPEQPLTFFERNDLRHKLFSARKFICDDAMSTMMGDLASSAFQAKTWPARLRAIEAMRTGARLPHRLTWIEFNLRKVQESARKYNPISPIGYYSPLEEMPKSEGWLLEQHPQVDTAFRATVYLGDDKEDNQGFDAWSFPWSYCWTSDDAPLPWKGCIRGFNHPDGRTSIAQFEDEVVGTIQQNGVFEVNRSEVKDMPEDMEKGLTNMSPVIVGLTGYKTPHVGAQLFESVGDMSDPKFEKCVSLLRDWSGVMRRMWALLSTINDLPVQFKEVKPAKGYFARRNYHKFLEHKVITLTVPQSEYVGIARSAVAKARRRAHQVRGHWRRDWRHEGQRIWIKEHQRGSAELGFVLHDYRVEAGKS